MPRRFTVIRDTNEKEGHGWFFNQTSSWCDNTKEVKLETGDYTFEGYEKMFTIERKATTSEISLNLFEERFEKELQRMENIDYPFIVCEFSYQDMLDFPQNSTIPKHRWEYLKVNNNSLLRALIEFQAKYKAKWILAGKDNGRRISSCIMKRMAEMIENAEKQPKPRRNKK